MTAKTSKKMIVFQIIILIIAFVLTGCVRGEVSVDIKENGSGTVGVAFGLNQEAKAFIAGQGGENPFDSIEESLGPGSTEDVNVSTWVDGDYEWSKAAKEFKSLEEIESAFKYTELFSRFSITQKKGLFRNEFILDAEMKPMDTEMPSTDNLGIDPYELIQMKFSARLPGELVETNGAHDAQDPNRMIWQLQGNEPVSVRARSTTWNMVNILLVIGIVVFFGLVVVGLLAFILIRSRKKVAPQINPGIS